jgi:hypothetical protein
MNGYFVSALDITQTSLYPPTISLQGCTISDELWQYGGSHQETHSEAWYRSQFQGMRAREAL